MKDYRAATLSSVVVVSSLVAFTPSLAVEHVEDELAEPPPALLR
jgi:hypothetical protein